MTHTARTVEIDFEPIGKRVDVPSDTHLLDAARQAGIGLASVCGGEGTCGRCRVVIMSG
ncbi:MAG TPA: 2Fe-2S iron-sulfur cluster-binding protein, partial [Anaerolineae bacterium]